MNDLDFVSNSNFFLKVASGVLTETGKRKSNEDTHLLLDDMRTVFPQLDVNQFWAIYAVYDGWFVRYRKAVTAFTLLLPGHGGCESSKLCAELLHRNIVKDDRFLNGNIPVALRNG